MNKIYFRSNNVYVLLCLIFFLVINSCTKDNNENSLFKTNVQDAKAWYENVYQIKSDKASSSVMANGTLDLAQIIDPDWNRSANYIRYGDDVLEIPIEDPGKFGIMLKDGSGSQVYQKEYSRTSFLLLKNAGGYQAYVMVIIADSGYVKNDLKKLENNHYNKYDTDFSGVLLYYTPKGKLLNHWLYKNGKIDMGASKVDDVATSGYKKQGIRSNNYITIETCIDYYTTAFVDGTWLPSQYSYTSCTEREVEVVGAAGGVGTNGGSTSSGGGGSSGSGPLPNNPCYPTSGGNTTNSYKALGNTGAEPGPVGSDDGGFPPPTQSPPCPTRVSSTAVIKNNVKDPCLHNMVEAAILRDISYNVSESMKGIFDSNSMFNLDFNDGVITKQDGSIDYDTQGNINTLGGTQSTINGRTVITAMDLQITLNSTTLPNSAEEFITAIIIHEVLHAYFRSSGNLDDHEVMVRQYIPWFEATLGAIYPSMLADDISALAYSGLTDNQAFGGFNEGQRAHYNSVRAPFMNGTKGTPCRK